MTKPHHVLVTLPPVEDLQILFETMAMRDQHLTEVIVETNKLIEDHRRQLLLVPEKLRAQNQYAKDRKESLDNILIWTRKLIALAKESPDINQPKRIRRGKGGG